MNQGPSKLLIRLLVTLALTASVTAQTFKTLHSFTGTDGANPCASLVLASNILYGTTYSGGSGAYGTVFKMSREGNGFTVLHAFTGGDGAESAAGLTLGSNVLYGTTSSHGPRGGGTVFALGTDGAGFVVLHSFGIGNDGALPKGGLVLFSNALYGTTFSGGVGGLGTVFCVNIDGTGYRTLHSFNSLTDGAMPWSRLVLLDNILYGTAEWAGPLSYGTIFSLHSDGSEFMNLHDFNPAPDGGWPFSGLVAVSNSLYGTAEIGGLWNNGTLFVVNPDGTGFVTLYSFTGESDGARPVCGLTASGNRLYGTAYSGGSSTNGTVFAVNTDGTGFVTLHSFTPRLGNLATNIDGASPSGELLLADGTLYGTTYLGGALGKGTLFSISLLPQLNLTRSGQLIILTWPTSVAGVDYTSLSLQSTTNLVSPVWTTVSRPPVLIDGLNTVSNVASSGQQFYRLVFQ